MVWPEIEKFRDRKSKIRFLQSQEKTITRVLFLFFDIWSWDSGRGLWSLISGDDVITGSCSKQLFVYEFWGFRVYWIQFWTPLSNSLRAFASLGKCPHPRYIMRNPVRVWGVVIKICDNLELLVSHSIVKLTFEWWSESCLQWFRFGIIAIRVFTGWISRTII